MRQACLDPVGVSLLKRCPLPPVISDYSRPVFSGCSLLGGASWRSRTAQPEKVPGGVFVRDCFECWLPVCVGGTVCVCVCVCFCLCGQARACLCVAPRARVCVWACVSEGLSAVCLYVAPADRKMAQALQPLFVFSFRVPLPPPSPPTFWSATL